MLEILKAEEESPKYHRVLIKVQNKSKDMKTSPKIRKSAQNLKIS